MNIETVTNLLRDCIEHAVSENEIAGCILSVIKDGNEIVNLNSGFADKEQNILVSENTIFRLYSMTKPITAAAFMTLIEKGFVDLREPVYQYVESFRHQKYLMPDGSLRTVSEKDPMRIKDLMNMTSGLVYPNSENAAGRDIGRVYEEIITKLDTDTEMTTAEFAYNTGKSTLLFAPGKGWHYGVSADILGAVIEKITGMKLSEYERESIFDPCNMTDTNYYVPDNKRIRLANAYMNRNDIDGADLVPYTYNNLGIKNNGKLNLFESGGAGLFATIEDYKYFAEMMMNDGLSQTGRRVLKPGSVRFLRSGQLNSVQQYDFDYYFGEQPGYTYGNLSRVMLKPGLADSIACKGEYGWDGWLGAYYANDPENKLTIILMMQKKDYGTGKLTRKIKNIIYSSL